VLDMRMPLPPPPSEALSITGYPMRDAASQASSAVVTIALLNTSCEERGGGLEWRKEKKTIRNIHEQTPVS